MGKRYVVGGSPGTGKSSVIDELALYQNVWVHKESAREVIAESHDKDIHRKDRLKFEKMVLERDINAYGDAPIRDRNCFFDCGFVEAVSYLKLENISVPKAFPDAIKRYRYDTVFYMPVWPKLFRDSSIPEKAKWAMTLDDMIRSTYMEEGYELIEVPLLPIKDRARFIMSNVDML
ncbi:MAG: ATP-binding protein [Candidatus Marsarchaeota archaeon]|nr:ATP-binding protein [Candidatus Marsarchaeota archaeon]